MARARRVAQPADTGDSPRSAGRLGEASDLGGVQGSLWPQPDQGHNQQLTQPAEPAGADSVAISRSGSVGAAPQASLVVRVMPDAAAVDKTFDYAVPEAWHKDGRAGRLAVGSIVRIDLAGRRLRGWVTEVGSQPPAGVVLRPLVKLTGMGPPRDLIDLAEWAAWRWAGRCVSFLRAASPPNAVQTPAAAKRIQRVSALDSGTDYDDLFVGSSAVTVLRLPPAADADEVAVSAARLGDVLVVAASARRAQRVAARLRGCGVMVADGMAGWARAAAGATVVGTRAAVWAPMPHLAAVVVFDEHDERLKNGSGPAWNARDVALERARRAGVAAVLVSAVPSLDALAVGDLRTVPRAAERGGWPVLCVLDRRRDDPVRGGLFAEGLKEHLVGAQRVAVVLNRTGRARLLACKACGELTRSVDGTQAMLLDDEGLVTPDGSERRPVVCADCGSTVLRNLRAGVTRAREELAALVGEPVGELTAKSDSVPSERVVIGTEAVLWRMRHAQVVVFLDFDQELLAARQRSNEQALGLLAAAGALTGGRQQSGKVVVQTRQPDHVVIRSAERGDPSILTEAEHERRRALRLPPYGAQALLSGPGAAQLANTAREAAVGAEVSMLGPRDGAYLLRAGAHQPLLDLLAQLPRPAERVRVEVDPLRV